MTSRCGYLSGPWDVTWRGSGCGMWLLLSLLLATGRLTCTMTPLLHMANFCSKSVQVNDSLLLDLTEDLPPDRVSVGYLTCVTTVEAPPGTRLMAHVLQLAICDKADTPDRLHIFDVSQSGQEKRLTPSTGLYGVLERPFLIYNTAGIIVPDFKSFGQRMRFNYQGKPTLIYRGFRLIITAFNDPSDSRTCRPGTLYCPYAGTCIPAHLRCDGLPNCGLDDSQDERNCEKEDVVTNLIEEYSTRTAVIAGVTGSLVFLACAAVVTVVILKYNRHKYYSGPGPAVHFSSRGGGTCRVKDEEDLTRLYAPPSYDDIVNPTSTSRHHGPPPAYHTVRAIHAQREYKSSDDESVRMSRNSCQHKLKSHPAQQKGHLPSFDLNRTHGACATDSEDDVRMHGTWPSDTDEEEDVRARRRRKGGKCKGKLRRATSQGGSASETSSGKATEDDRKGSKSTQECRGIRSPSCPRSLNSPADAESGSITPASKSEGESSPLRTACPKCLAQEGCSCDVSDVRGPSEVVSETESQLAESKRNSRTESNSRSGSPASVNSENPAKHLDSPAKSLDNNSAKCLDSQTAQNLDNSAKSLDSQTAQRLDSPFQNVNSQENTSCQHSFNSQFADSVADKAPDAINMHKDSCFVDLNPSADKNTASQEEKTSEAVSIDVGATLVAPC